MRCNNLLLTSAVLLFLTASLALADGIFMSSEQLHLYSPEQKAIIVWNGKTEQMILASKVQTDKISNMVWIIPIQSRIKPEVQKSDFAIFKDLISYFGDKEQRSHVFGRDQAAGKNAMEGVEVIETKKVDIYDIAILRATSANDLFQWLNANGYRLPEDAKPIIEKYINRPSMYFVANKIDLRNKFNADAQQAQDFYQGMKQRLEQKKQTNEKELNKLRDDQIAYSASWQTIEDGLAREKEFSFCVIEKIKSNFQQMGKVMQTIAPDPHFLNTYIFSIDNHWTVTLVDFERLDNSYFFIRYDNQTVLTDNFLRTQGRDMTGTKYFSSAIGQEAQQYADMVRTVLTKELTFKKELDQQIKDVKNKAKDIDMILSAMSQWSEGSFFCNFTDFQKNFPEGTRHEIMVDAASGISPDPVNEKSDYCQTIVALQTGMAAPLKISFQPDIPYYPLEISSLGEGSAMIDIYVIADQAVVDQNKVFERVKPLMLNGVLKEKITKEFQTGPWAYVTRFTWEGRLKDLKRDAEFVRH
ncbi:MAG: DUF2330 domain-containing protein [Candidatus Omnitrophota bacterium]